MDSLEQQALTDATTPRPDRSEGVEDLLKALAGVAILMDETKSPGEMISVMLPDLTVEDHVKLMLALKLNWEKVELDDIMGIFLAALGTGITLGEKRASA
jgi:hypothetical protein